MTDNIECSCPAGRPLGEDHLTSCPAWEFTDANGRVRDATVHVLRNLETGRPIAVPDEIVSVAEREYRAYKMHERGKSWTEVARLEGYPNGLAASEAVARYLDEGRAVVGAFRRQEVIATEVGMLGALRDAMWDGAVLEHKPTHVMALLAVHDRWVKLFGLDEADVDDATVQTVVIPTDDYIAQLRAADAEPQADAG